MRNTRYSERDPTPDALLEGMADALSRPPAGSQKRGPKPRGAKLTSEQWEAIRRLRSTHKIADLAAMFSVSRAQISRITKDIKGRHPAQTVVTEALIAQIRAERPHTSLHDLSRKYRITERKIATICSGIRSTVSGGWRRVLTPAQIEELRALRPMHRLDELAERFGCSTGCIIRSTKGIEGPAKRKRLTADMKVAIRADRKAGLKLQDIAAKYGISTSNAGMWGGDQPYESKRSYRARAARRPK